MWEDVFDPLAARAQEIMLLCVLWLVLGINLLMMFALSAHQPQQFRHGLANRQALRIEGFTTDEA